MATPFHVELVTPERVLLSAETDGVSMTTDGGEIAFLAHHEDYVGAVDICLVTIALLGDGAHEGASGTVRAAVHGGFVHVDDDGVRILAGVAELGEEIDVERARRAASAAESQSGSQPTGSQPTGSPATGSGPSGGATEDESGVALSPTMIALLYPDSADASRRRAAVRLEAAGAGARGGDGSGRTTTT